MEQVFDCCENGDESLKSSMYCAKDIYMLVLTHWKLYRLRAGQKICSATYDLSSKGKCMQATKMFPWQLKDGILTSHTALPFVGYCLPE